MMAITKRTRYEVLRRDDHTCRYCGAIAPEVKLTVDHVTPAALGGTDDPSNLVAACRDCNAGKSSTTPDAALVADVRQDALRHAELIRQAYEVLVARMGERDDYIDTWLESWTMPTAPVDWRNTVGRWFEMGVPVEIPADAARVACSRTSVRDDGRFAYMCGIVWNQVRIIDEMAELARHVEGSFATDEWLTEVRIDAYEYGYRQAEINALRNDPLSVVIDRIGVSC